MQFALSLCVSVHGMVPAAIAKTTQKTLSKALKSTFLPLSQTKGLRQHQQEAAAAPPRPESPSGEGAFSLSASWQARPFILNEHNMGVHATQVLEGMLQHGNRTLYEEQNWLARNLSVCVWRAYLLADVKTECVRRGAFYVCNCLSVSTTPARIRWDEVLLSGTMY